MTQFKSILPYSSTTLEKDLERSVDLTQFHGPLEELRRAKLDAQDSYVPFLIWEYGLGELLPYLKDPKRAIAEGVLWQRLRGTPRSLVIALSWIDFEAVIEQEEAGSIYFSEFMLDPGEVVRDPLLIRDVIAISELAAPARSRLSRVYHGYDIRRLKLSEGPKGELSHHLLSDYSGVHHQGIRVSFGETFTDGAELGTPATGLYPDHEDTQRVYADDVFRLSVNRLGQFRDIGNPYIAHSRLYTLGVEGASETDQGVWPDRKFQRAQIVLSDSTEDGGLSDINGVMAPDWYDVFEGDEVTLSDNGVRLSDQVNTFHRMTVLDRTLNVHRGSNDPITYGTSISLTGSTIVLQGSLNDAYPAYLSEPAPIPHHRPMQPPVSHYDYDAVYDQSQGGRSASGSLSSAVYKGQHWLDIIWPENATWASINVVIASTHTTETAE